MHLQGEKLLSDKASSRSKRLFSGRTKFIKGAQMERGSPELALALAVFDFARASGFATFSILDPKANPWLITKREAVGDLDKLSVSKVIRELKGLFRDQFSFDEQTHKWSMRTDAHVVF